MEKKKHEAAQAVVGATGITGDGRRCGRGLALSPRASRSNWTRVLTGLTGGGRPGAEGVVSADHAGLTRALAALRPEAVWARGAVPVLRTALDALHADGRPPAPPVALCVAVGDVVAGAVKAADSRAVGQRGA